MRRRNLTMGEMSQFMAEEYGTANFARKKRRGGSLRDRLRRKKSPKRSKLALAAQLGAGAAALGGTGYLAGTKRGRGLVKSGYGMGKGLGQRTVRSGQRLADRMRGMDMR